MTAQQSEAAVRPATGTLEVMVSCARHEAASVASYEFMALDGQPLPPWDPGSHLDVHLPSGTIRQYSLCGDPDDRDKYRIAVLEQPQGRGGSLEAHRELRPGARLRIGLPRQNFALVPAKHYVFVAGGIGITPVLAMARHAERTGQSWELVYGARSAEHFAFADELLALNPAAVRFLAADNEGHPDLDSLVATSTDSAVYCCGPAGLMDALTEKMDAAGRLEDLHLERFSPASVQASPATLERASTGSFTLELVGSGQEITVDPGQTTLEAIRAAGVEHPSSCEMGFCGTCEVRVRCGLVDHRDDLLTEEERAENSVMMPCVSRSLSERLVIEL